MSTPGFTAQASLSPTRGHHCSRRPARASNTQRSDAIYAALYGQDFPNHKCTCKGCGTGGGDVTGQCATVCKDKTVYDKGSESYDYCKAKLVRPPRDIFSHIAGDVFAR